MWGGGGHYNAWAALLDRWAAGEQADPATLPALRQEDLSGDGWERLTNRLTGALDQRMTAWAEALARAVSGAGDEFSRARALAQARNGLRPIRALAVHPGLPATLTAQLATLVDSQIRAVQDQLERQADRMRRAGARPAQVEASLRTVRDNSLVVAVAEAPTDPGYAKTDSWYVDPTAPTRRRIVPG